MEMKIRLDKEGRLVIPAEFRRALGLRTGDEVILRLKDGEVCLIPLHESITLAQKKVRKYVPEDVSLVDALIRDRREEVARE
jgi:AbrB family looped-hinge helix DNA binding protein